ncbi:MAG TPA: c-type cytochrome [Terriglobia bacterium]|nr:c-type cytochrome [Terriglobia bacterium]
MTLRHVTGQFWIVILFSSACGLLAGTCFGGRKGVRENSPAASVFGGAPAATARLQNPYRGEAKAVLAGKKLFGRHCAQCHGNNAEGLGKAPPLRSPIVQQAPEGVLYWFLKKGKVRAGMPSWSGLPAQQRWQIVSFLKSLQ